MTDQECITRNASEEDLDTILGMFKNEAGHTAEQTEEYRADLLEMLHDEKFNIRVISENGVDLGWVLEETGEFPYEFEVLDVLNEAENELNPNEIIEFFQNEHPEVNWVVIDAIDLSPEERGRGLGQQTMQALLEEYREKGVDWVTFRTQIDNKPMQQIGRKLGFALLKIPAVEGEDGKPIDDKGQVLAIKKLL